MCCVAYAVLLNGLHIVRLMECVLQFMCWLCMLHIMCVAVCVTHNVCCSVCYTCVLQCVTHHVCCSVCCSVLHIMCVAVCATHVCYTSDVLQCITHHAGCSVCYTSHVLQCVLHITCVAVCGAWSLWVCTRCVCLRLDCLPQQEKHLVEGCSLRKKPRHKVRKPPWYNTEKKYSVIWENLWPKMRTSIAQ